MTIHTVLRGRLNQVLEALANTSYNAKGDPVNSSTTTQYQCRVESDRHMVAIDIGREVAANHLVYVGLSKALPDAPTTALHAGGNLDQGATYQYCVTFVTAAGETIGGAVASRFIPIITFFSVDLSAIPLGVGGVTSRKIYRTEGNGSTFKLLTTLADNTTTTYYDNTADAGLGATLSSTGNTGGQVPTITVKDRVVLPDGTVPQLLAVETLRDRTGTHHQVLHF